MATDPDPARETVPAETWTNEDLAPLTRDEFRAMLKDGHFNVPRLRTKDAMLAVLIGTHFAHRRAWNECDSLRSDLAARTTARDQALAERDALRKELDALRAARPAPLGDRAREALRLAKVFHAEAHNKVGDFRDWECIKAKFYAALDSLTDSDLAPDPVWVECVEACMAYAADWGNGDPIVSSWGRCILAGRAARAAKGDA